MFRVTRPWIALIVHTGHGDAPGGIRHSTLRAQRPGQHAERRGEDHVYLKRRNSSLTFQSVLIHSGAGAFGIAAITLAQSMGAVIYATVSTDEKKDYLVNELGVQRENIFQSRDTSFVEGIMKATAGRGVDIVLNSLTGDLLHASWRCCAKFGRFVEIGKRDIIDAGKLDMDVFLRSVTFTAFDMSELYYHEDAYYQSMWNR